MPTANARRPRTRPTDALVAVVVAMVSIGALLVSDEPGARSPDVLGILLLVLMAAALVPRRRAPTSVVAVVSVLALVSFGMGYPGGPPTLALLVALYSVAAAGHRWWTAVVAIVFAGGGLVFRAVVEADAPVSIALDSALFVLVSLLGDAVHSRRQLAEETRERLRLTDAEREAETQRRVAEERLRIARELHDVMAHSITTMSVQAGAALDAFEQQPDAARSMLRSMRAAARQATQELRATVSLLRDDSREAASRQPAPSLAQIDVLVAGVEHAGLRVELTTTGDVHTLPPAVELTAYRVVQEALTNVIRHAGATSVRVAVHYTPDHLLVQIDDDGHGGTPTDATGFGLRGLSERVDALEGAFRVGPSPAGGLRVRAEIPAGEVRT